MLPDNPTANLDDTARQLRLYAAESGFAIVGVAPAAASDRAEVVRAWIREGRHGEMHYLAEHLEKRLDPRQLLPGAQAVIVVADRYASEIDDSSPDANGADKPEPRPPLPAGRIARYAWGDDYHNVIKKRLFELADLLRDRHPGHDFKVTVDTAPTLEREHATRAGLGWIGKHTLLIHPQLGSYLLLGTIVTTLPLPASTDNRLGLAEARDGCGPSTLMRAIPSSADSAGPEAGGSEGRQTPEQQNVEQAEQRTTLFAKSLITDHCGTCTRCIDACPTQCITPYQVDGHRCISYLTLEHRSLIDIDLHEAMGDWIAGCDVCQEVCPHNRPRPRKSEPTASETRSEIGVSENGVASENGVGYRSAPPVLDAYAPRPPAPAIDLLAVLNWSAEDRQQAFTKSALKRVKLPQLKRNALIAAGNYIIAHGRDDAHAAALLEAIQQRADDPDEDELVRETAKQTLARLRESPRITP